jgi:hypothetical protein
MDGRVNRLMFSLLFATLLILNITGCDDYSHSTIVNTQPANYINLISSNTYGGNGFDWGTSIISAPDNDYVITGSTTSNGYGLNTLYLSKINPNGDQTWYKWFGGWGEDNGEEVCLSPDGYIIVAGVTESFELATGRVIDPNSGKMINDYNFYLVKISVEGDIVWQKPYGDSLYTEWGTSIAVSSDGYLVAGYQSKVEFDEDFYFLKTDLDGNLAWQKSYGTGDRDIACSIIKTQDDNYVIGGYTESEILNRARPYLIKIDDNGTILWEKPHSDTAYSKTIYNLIEAGNGDLVATGSSRPDSIADPSFNSLYILRMNSAGDILWEKTFVDCGINDGRCVIENSAGYLMICGQNTAQNSIWIAKLEADGRFLWSDETGSEGFGMSMIARQSNYAITGSTKYPNHRTINNVLLLEVEEDKKNIE